MFIGFSTARVLREVDHRPRRPARGCSAARRQMGRSWTSLRETSPSPTLPEKRLDASFAKYESVTNRRAASRIPTGHQLLGDNEEPFRRSRVGGSVRWRSGGNRSAATLWVRRPTRARRWSRALRSSSSWARITAQRSSMYPMEIVSETAASAE